MGAIRKQAPAEKPEQHDHIEEQQEFFLLNENSIVWKVAVPIVAVIIGFLLAGGFING